MRTVSFLIVLTLIVSIFSSDNNFTESFKKQLAAIKEKLAKAVDRFNQNALKPSNQGALIPGLPWYGESNAEFEEEYLAELFDARLEQEQYKNAKN